MKIADGLGIRYSGISNIKTVPSQRKKTSIIKAIGYINCFFYKKILRKRR